MADIDPLPVGQAVKYTEEQREALPKRWYVAFRSDYPMTPEIRQIAMYPYMMRADGLAMAMGTIFITAGVDYFESYTDAVSELCVRLARLRSWITGEWEKWNAEGNRLAVRQLFPGDHDKPTGKLGTV